MKIGLFYKLVILFVFAVSAFAEKQQIVPPEWAHDRPAGAAKPIFSAGILIDGTLYIAGQMGADPKTGEFADTFEGEVKRAFENIGAVLKTAGMSLDDVVAVTVYLSDMDLFPRMNTVYRTYFHDPMPTRTTIGVAKLASPKGHIEITVIAHK